VPVEYGVTQPPEALPVGGKGGDPGDDYPAYLKDAPQDSLFDPWGEYNRECTSFVAWALHSRNGFEMPFHDDAIEWGTDAKSRGFPVNSTPAVGSVAWSNQGAFGHVAWVADVGNGNVTIQEYNRHSDGRFGTRTVAASTFAGYIHFKDLRPGDAPQPAPNPSPPPPAPAPVPSAPAPVPSAGTGGSSNRIETAGGVTHTWTNYTNAGGTQGPSIAGGQGIEVSCRLTGFKVADGNTWWYRIASAPWSNGFYASADAFYNNGATSGTLYGTPFVDEAVPMCDASSPPPPVASPPAPSPPPPPAPAPPSLIYQVTNYDNDGTHGVYLRNSSNVNDVNRDSAHYVTYGTNVSLICGEQGSPVGPYANTAWDYVEVVSGPLAGAHGHLSEHWLNTPVGANEHVPGEPTCGSSAPPPPPQSSAASAAIAYAKGYLGTSHDSGLCLAFVQEAYAAAGITLGTGGTAANYWAVNPKGFVKHTDTNPAVGALVFWGATPSNSAGHVGIYEGNDTVISTSSWPQSSSGTKVHEWSFSGRNNAGYPYLGWMLP
jgi:surface antigen